MARLSTINRHLCAAESFWVALAYHRIIGAKLQGEARTRTSIASEFVEIPTSENFTFADHAGKEISLATDSDRRANDIGKIPRAAVRKAKQIRSITARFVAVINMDKLPKNESRTRRATQNDQYRNNDNQND